MSRDPRSEECRWPHFKSSSKAVQKRQAQYTLLVNDMADVIHRPARPAETKPDKAKMVVVKTPKAPRASK